MTSASASGRPIRSEAALPSTVMAGQAWGSRRRSSERACPDSSPTRGKTQRSEGTPSREAVSAEQRSRAAAWSTVHWVECHLLYGKANGRFDGDGVAISRASIGAGNAARGLACATWLHRAHSAATSVRCSASERPSAARNGVLLDRVPQTVGDLDRLEQRARAAVDDIGHRPGLFGLHRVPARAGRVPRPPLGLAADHHGHLRPARRDGGKSVGDQGLLGDAQLDEMGARPFGTHPIGDEAAGVGVRPGPLGHGDPVDHCEQLGSTGVVGRPLHRPSHQLGRLDIPGRRSQAHEDRGPRIERAATGAHHGSAHAIRPSAGRRPAPYRTRPSWSPAGPASSGRPGAR